MKPNISNRDRVSTVYQAFGRGDVPTILGMLSEDVVWEYGMAPNDVPWLAQRRGRAGAAKFFESLGALTIHRFVPKTLLEAENIVVALVDLDATVKATGKPIHEEDETHIWHFNAEGQVIRFRHVVDSAQHVAAHRG